MTPKEKATQLVDKYYIFNHIGNRHAVKCALIAVDEIIESVLPSSDFGGDINKHTIEYWQEVEQEINKL